MMTEYTELKKISIKDLRINIAQKISQLSEMDLFKNLTALTNKDEAHEAGVIATIYGRIEKVSVVVGENGPKTKLSGIFGAIVPTKEKITAFKSSTMVLPEEVTAEIIRNIKTAKGEFAVKVYVVPTKTKPQGFSFGTITVIELNNADEDVLGSVLEKVIEKEHELEREKKQQQPTRKKQSPEK